MSGDMLCLELLVVFCHCCELWLISASRWCGRSALKWHLQRLEHEPNGATAARQIFNETTDHAHPLDTVYTVLDIGAAHQPSTAYVECIQRW